MSLPYQIADRIDFEVMLCDGVGTSPSAWKAQPLAQGNEPLENVLDVLIRSDPSNTSDSADPNTWIYIGNSNQQTFPLRANESVNLRVTKRDAIYFKGPKGQKLHVVSARLNMMNVRSLSQ